MRQLIEEILNEPEIKQLFVESEEQYLFSQVSKGINVEKNLDKHLRLLFLMLNHLYAPSNQGKEANKEGMDKLYILLRSIDINNDSHRESFANILGIDGIDSKTLYYFYLASVALKSDKVINIRIDLTDFKHNESNNDSNTWKERVINKILIAFILLVRKSNGFADIRDALVIIDKLKSDQLELEKKYLESLPFQSELQQAYVLLGLYHASKTIVETAQYLIEGYQYKERIEVVIRQHSEAARKALVSEPRIQSLIDILEENLKILQSNAIWSKTKFNDKIQKLCKIKSELGILELLPSQREALNRNLLDVASNVTVVQMPTSAGKTLLAEFNILVTKALRQDSKIIYVVPSRALVNQVYFELKRDLEQLNLVIEKTSSAIEVDPTEDGFLNNRIDVLVSTPEKLDLLIRRNHSTVDDVSLFIIDEAHTIQNGHRGAKLELLLAILKRERPNSKFMLLSPFIKKAGDTITDWLGGGNSISIDWRPSEKLLLGLNNHKTTRKDDFKFNILSSVYSTTDVDKTVQLDNPYQLKSTGKKDRILEFAVNHFAQDEKTFLVLCEGPGSVDTRADFLFNHVGVDIASGERDLVRKFIDDEVGRETRLTKVLKRGIATHHAGLSDETKLLVEHLIRQKEIKYVCSTTTVAEGVNFPVSTVFFDSYYKGDNLIDSNDFWNIAGRAGRTMIDNFGKIILPFNSASNTTKAQDLIKTSANELTSVLAELFINGDKIVQQLNENHNFIGLMGNYYNSLAPLLQYFVHLITVGKNTSYANQIEDLFKDSLEYYLLETEEQKNKFINICKTIYLHLEERYKNDRGVLSFADKTGFSVPSVLAVMAEKSKNPEISKLETWTASSMFSRENPENLAEKIKVISALRETKMGTDSQVAPFNAELIAKILISWVKGDKLHDISNQHPAYSTIQDENKKINDFVKKINDLRFKASWGLSALEGIVKGNEQEIKDSHIPSLIYYGVDNEKSLMLRMAGVPRALSFSLTPIIGKESKSFNLAELRKRIKGLTGSDWDSLRPRTSSLDGQEWKRISEILVN